MEYSALNSLLVIANEAESSYNLPGEGFAEYVSTAANPAYVRINNSVYDEYSNCDVCERTTNFCKYIDNNILYYNASSPFIASSSLMQYVNSDFVYYMAILGNQMNDFVSTKIHKCSRYDVVANTDNNKTFDCGIYTGSDGTLGKDIINEMLLAGTEVAGISNLPAFIKGNCDVFIDEEMNGFGSDIVNADTLPINNRTSLRNDAYNWLIKPSKLPAYAPVATSSDAKLRGCFTDQDNGDSGDNSIFNCKIPIEKTNYINSTSFSDPTVGSEVNEDEYEVTVCSRTSSSSHNLCGKRESENLSDLCLEIRSAGDLTTAVSPVFHHTKYFLHIFRTSSIPYFRFRAERHNRRNIYILKDYSVTGNCFSDNPKVSSSNEIPEGERTHLKESDVEDNNNSAATDYIRKAGSVCVPEVATSAVKNGRFVDTLQFEELHIAAKGASYILVPMLGVGCGLMAIGGIDPEACIGRKLCTISNYTVYSKYYIFLMGSDLVFPKEFASSTNETGGLTNTYTNRGFVSRANITNNNNYVYRYYPRSDNIQEDIKNKLESNIEGGSRYYHDGNVLSLDIIKKCSIGKLVGTTADCDGNDRTSGSNMGVLNFHDRCNYSFGYYKLNENGDRISVCKENKIEKCLHSSQVKCLKSFGVEFIRNDYDYDLNEDIIMSGAHLKKYEMCGSIGLDGPFDRTCPKSDSSHKAFVPVDIISYTKNDRSNIEMKDDVNCQFDNYGDPKGNLALCRGFQHLNLFYTEIQPAPMPLHTSPFFFYTLITPKNTPEIFNPSLVETNYYTFLNNNRKELVLSVGKIILDFFNPKLEYSYEYAGDVNDPDFRNIRSGENNFISEIGIGDKIGYPYQVVYRSRTIGDMVYKYVLDKTYLLDSEGTYTPKVCLYKVGIGTYSGSDVLNSCLKKHNGQHLTTCSGMGCLSAEANQCFIAVDKDIECYARGILFIDNFIFKPDRTMDYRNPVINVYMKPDGKTASEVMAVANEHIYGLKEDGNSGVKDAAINDIQAYGINLERSYCSQIYYDYYNSTDTLLKEEKKEEGRDEGLINRLRVKISKIEAVISSDCYEENGQNDQILINESSFRTITDAAGVENNVVYRETAPIQRYTESYGGTNEVCLAEHDVKHILDLYGKQRGIKVSMPTVIAFKDINKRQRKTKCLLDDVSLEKPECLIANKVYVHCAMEEIGSSCVNKLNITKQKLERVKEVDCLNVLNGVKISGVNEYNIDLVKACYKGGFNFKGNVYKNSTGGGVEIDISCKCSIVGENIEIDKDLYTTRTMTAREYGLCVNLAEPNACPAVKYYDYSGKYVDDKLALGFTSAEMEQLPSSYYEQHVWRTNEKINGIMPVVFFTSTLGHAEFPASVYCSADDTTKTNEYFNNNCIGGIKMVSGECNGYWKWNKKDEYGVQRTDTPLAICSKKTHGGKTIYEYKLVNGLGCDRYICPPIAYKSGVVDSGDEKKIEENFANMFTEFENNNYAAIILTDYKSTTNDEETVIGKIDPRGSSNGFSSWRNVVSIDVAQEIIGEQCLTGFGPAGSNYYVQTQIAANSIISGGGTNDINYDNTNTLKNKYNKFVLLIQEQKNRYDNIIANNIYKNRMYYPLRRCDQKGNWMTVEDVYNLKLIAPNESNKNYYYNSADNFWVDVMLNRPDGLPEEHNKIKGYCERLVCPEVVAQNINIYDNELVATSGNMNKYTVWKHTGGANWTRTAAPRNTSANVNETGINTDSSKNLHNIFIDGDAGVVSNKYKFIKKVNGICKNEYGYYERGTNFLYNTFMSQFQSLDTSIINNFGTDPRGTAMIDINSVITKPLRVCTSTGLWSGVLNRCFRSCEMMDIYHVVYDDSIKNNNFSEHVLTENDDILAVTNPDVNVMENRFLDLELDEQHAPKNSEGYTLGDYLTGGATWPRSLVTVGDSVETSQSSLKKGLRYKEIETTCDSSFNTDDDNRVRQYVMVANTAVPGTGIRPKRKCYEDGTWGPVEGNTRCVLAKNCKVFSFSLEDLRKLVLIYNSNISTNELQRLELLNIALSGTEITYNPNKKVANINNCGKGANLFNCLIYEFSATNTYAGNSLSENPMIKYGSAAYLVPTDPYSLMCNTSSISEVGGIVYQPGWSLKFSDIGQYFMPVTCNSGDKAYFSNSTPNITGDSGGGTEDTRSLYGRLSFTLDNTNNTIHYAKETYLNYLYDTINSGVSEVRFPGTTVTDETHKGIVIGTRGYSSYQLLAGCDERYFYNNVFAATIGENTVYTPKKIVFECKYAGGGGGMFGYHGETRMNNDGVQFIAAKNCLTKKCGGSNVYQPNWSESIIREVFGNTSQYGTVAEDGTITSDRSAMECDPGYAFVLNDEVSYLNSLGAALTYYTDASNREYRQEKFVSKIELTCTASLSNPNKINNRNVAANSFYKHKYGELIYQDKAPRVFCRNVYKDNCNTISEETIMRDTRFNNTVDTGAGGYCVRMGCKAEALKLDNKVILDPTSPGYNASTSPTFTLPAGTIAGGTPGDHYYRFGENVVIQSYGGDFNESVHKVGNITIDHKYRIENYGTADSLAENGSRVCPDGQDVYNEGVGAAYDFYVFVTLVAAGDEAIKNQIYGCFNKLQNYSAIENVNSCTTNYVDTGKTHSGKKICVEYRDPVNNPMNNINGVINTYISSYNSTKINTLKDKTAEFIVNSLIFTTTGSTINPNFNFSSEVRNDINNRINDAKTAALTEANNAFRVLSDDISCYYNSDGGSVVEDSGITIVSETYNFGTGPETINIRADLEKYKQYTGQSSNLTLYYKAAATGSPAFLGVPVTNSPTACTNLTKIANEEATASSSRRAFPVIAGSTCFIEGIDYSIEWFIDSSNTECDGIEGEKVKRGDDYACISSGGKLQVIGSSSITNVDVSSIGDGSEWQWDVDGEGGRIPCKLKGRTGKKYNESASKCFYAVSNASEIDGIYNNGNNATLFPSDVVVMGSLAENIIYGGESYVSDGDGTCPELRFNRRVETSVSGQQIGSLGTFNTIYEERLAIKVAEAKATLVNQLKNNTPSIYNELFNRYYKIIRMEDFLRSNANNLTYYQDYLGTLELEDEQEFTVDAVGDDAIGIRVFDALSEITSNIVYEYTVSKDNKDTDDIKCSKLRVIPSDDEESDPTLETMSEECSNNPSFISIISNNYNEHVVDFLGSSISSVTVDSDLNETRMQYDDNIENCKNIYQNYFTQMAIYNNRPTTNDFRRGFFMVMKCTPEGWKVYDSPVCKKRCSGNLGTVRLDPTGIGCWNVNAIVDNLRYGEAYDTKLASNAEASCAANRYTDSAVVQTSCGEDGQFTGTEKWSEMTGVDGWSKKYNALKVYHLCRAQTHTTIAGVTKYCGHSWTGTGKSRQEHWYSCPHTVNATIASFSQNSGC
jgi:hypothetical protein